MRRRRCDSIDNRSEVYRLSPQIPLSQTGDDAKGNQRKDQLFGDAEYVGDDSYRPARADNPQFSEGVRQTRLQQLYFISR